MKSALLLLLTGVAFAGLPDAPKTQKTADARFFLTVSADFAASITDAAISSRYVSRGPCYETNPAFGSLHPSTARYYGQSLGVTAAATGLSYFAKRHHWFWWSWPLVVDGSQHAAGVITTLGNCKR